MVATGLAAEKVVQEYAKSVTKMKGAWATSSTQERLATLLNPANTSLVSLGVPRVVGIIDPMGSMAGTASYAGFSRATWTMWFNPDILAAALSDQEFWRGAAVVYHEARHTEQTFRVARKLASEGKPADKIVTMIGIPLNVATTAVQAPLPPAKKQEWQEAEGWQLNMEAGADGLSRADLVNTQKDVAVTKYEESRLVWRSLEKVLNNDPAAPAQLKAFYTEALAKPDGAANMKQLTDTWRQNYVVAREKAKQWYLAYAKMPVELDAWYTGGLVESAVGLPASTPEDQLANLDKDERVMIPVALMQLLGGSQQERDLITALGRSL